MITGDALAPRLVAAWKRQCGIDVNIAEIKPLSAGASSQTFSFAATSSEGPSTFVVQLFAGGEQFAGALSKPDQARTQQTAALAGVATPEVVLITGAEDELPEGFVSRWRRGETLGKRIVGDARYAQARRQLPQDCAQVLARIHALDVSRFAFLPLRSAEFQVQELAETHRRYGEALPVFEATLAWLSAHLPAVQKVQLVHGDFRTGNLLVDVQGLSGVLDWELAHLGDAMEDLGWLCMRSWRFGQDQQAVGGFGLREPFYRQYQRASGVEPDPQAVRFWETLGTLKWGVICQWFAHRRLSGAIGGLEPAVIGRRVSEVEIQLLDLLQGRGY